MAAPAALASSGSISGTGFAMGKTTASFAMDRIMSWDTIWGALTPTNTSAPLRASAKVPLNRSGLVMAVIWAWAGFISAPSHRMPQRSTIFRCFTPRSIRCLPMAMPADPAPLTTILISSIRLPTTRRALRTAAPTTMAVPC